MSTDEPRADRPGTRERLEAERESLEAEIAALRARGQGTPAQLRALERDLTGLRSQLATVSAQNERLVRTLRDAREQIVTLKSEVDRLAQPPAAYGIVIETFDDGTADILTSGRKMHVAVSPSLDEGALVPGREVMLNEAMNVVAAHGYETTGEVVLCKEILDDGRVLVVAQADEERVCRVAASLDGETIRAGDALLLESRSGFVFERIPKAEVADLVLEEVPDIDYTDIGGLTGQIEAIRDAVELPVPAPRPLRRAPAQAPEGRAALRPARLWQDDDRQGRRGIPGPQGRREGGPRAREVLLPQHQGPRAAQQVRRRDRAAHPADLPAGAREVQRGLPRRRLLRRDGVALPHPRVGRLLRRRDDDRPAAARRDRRRRGARERHRHRRLEPRGHDRPRDPAARAGST